MMLILLFHETDHISGISITPCMLHCAKNHIHRVQLSVGSPFQTPYLGRSILQVWDTRQRSCSHSFNAHEEYISDITFAADSMKLLATRYVIEPTSLKSMHVLGACIM